MEPYFNSKTTDLFSQNFNDAKSPYKESFSFLQDSGNDYTPASLLVPEESLPGFNQNHGTSNACSSSPFLQQHASNNSGYQQQQNSNQRQFYVNHLNFQPIQTQVIYNNYCSHGGSHCQQNQNASHCNYFKSSDNFATGQQSPSFRQDLQESSPSPIFKQKKARGQKVRKYHRYENVTAPRERFVDPSPMDFNSQNVVNSFNCQQPVSQETKVLPSKRKQKTQLQGFISGETCPRTERLNGGANGSSIFKTEKARFKQDSQANRSFSTNITSQEFLKGLHQLSGLQQERCEPFLAPQSPCQYNSQNDFRNKINQQTATTSHQIPRHLQQKLAFTGHQALSQERELRIQHNSSLSLAQELLGSEDSIIEEQECEQKSFRRERLGSLFFDCLKDNDDEEMIDHESHFKSIEKSTPTFEHMSEISSRSFSSQHVENGSSHSQQILSKEPELSKQNSKARKAQKKKAKKKVIKVCPSCEQKKSQNQSYDFSRSFCDTSLNTSTISFRSLGIHKAPVKKLFKVTKYPAKGMRKIGQYNLIERMGKILSYKKKKIAFKLRSEKKIQFQEFQCRTEIAKKRMRVGGRFLTKTEEQDLITRISRSDSEEQQVNVQEVSSQLKQQLVSEKKVVSVSGFKKQGDGLSIAK